MFPFAQLLRRTHDCLRMLMGDREGRPYLTWLSTSVRLRWAVAFTLTAAALIFAFTAQHGGSSPDSAITAATRTVRSTPKPTVRPTPQPTLVPTAAPTPLPATPSPAPAPAPRAAPAAEIGASSGSATLPGTGPNYYVDDVSGSDANSGTSEATALRSLDKASAITLSPGERLLFRRGGAWTGTLKIEESGSGGQPVVIASYGSGPLPIIQGARDCIALFGSGVVITQIQVQDCWSGVRIPDGAAFNRLEGNVMTGNVAGVLVSSGASDNVIAGNTFQDNNKMSVNTPGGYDDSGAFGVLLNGDRNEVAHNVITGSDTSSYDYGRDGAAVEVYGGQGNSIHHNVAVDNHAFSELGNQRTRDNTFAYNLVRSSLPDSTFLVTRGGEDGYGPVLNTRLFNNTVVMTGAGSQGFVCHGGCNGGVLTMRNNIIQAVHKAGYADGAFDEDYNLYAGGITQFPLGPNSNVGNPLFDNPAGGDFHLGVGSPAVDSGVDSGYGSDIDGRSVPSDGNADGVPAPDRGALES
jgi:parallel beta-helix repeat protein